MFRAAVEGNQMVPGQRDSTILIRLLYIANTENITLESNNIRLLLYA